VQGYVYAALVARSHCATEAGDTSLAATLRKRAETLKENFNRDFWVEDGEYFAMGLDGDKRQLDAVTSNMGHCLWTGIVDQEKAPAVARHLLGSAMFSGWGIRTLSESMVGYNPISYHNGSVWPHDNALCAAGLMRYGFIEEAHRVMEALVDASAYFGDLLPELFAGLGRRAYGFPVTYPTSCSPQAWAAASPLLFLRTMLRFEPDIRNSRLHLAPVIPESIGRLRLERIPIMGGHLTVEMRGDESTVVDAPPGLTIEREPRPATY
jgi:glycogen debranching enzyme